MAKTNTRKVSAAQAAINAAKADEAAKTKAATTAAPATKPETAPKPTKEELLAQHKPNYLHHYAEVTGGKKFKGKTVEIAWVFINKRFQPSCRIVVDGVLEFMDASNLTVGDKLPKARIDELEKARTAEAEATVYLPVDVRRVTEGAVQLKNPGWFKPSYFPKSMVTNTGAVDEKGRDIYELPVWKIRKENGNDCVDAALAIQDKMQAIVDAYDGEEGEIPEGDE